ncbi:hypothetical protein D3C87_1630020 [compost metagenome]
MASRLQHYTVALFGPDTDIFILPQVFNGNTSVRIDDEYFIKFRGPFRQAYIQFISLGAKGIDLLKSRRIAGYSDVQQLISVTEFHSGQHM